MPVADWMSFFQSSSGVSSSCVSTSTGVPYADPLKLRRVKGHVERAAGGAAVGRHGEVQPAGAPSVTLVELTVMKSSRVPPTWAAPGAATVWLERLPLVLAASTNPTLAWVALTGFVVVPVPPSLSVTVSVTSRVPAAP